jgi:outer membrane immunogenic protein
MTVRIEIAKRMLAGLAMMAVAAPALAADLGPGRVRDAPPPPEAYYEPVYNWTGLYFGGTAGGAFANTDHYYDRQNGKNDHGQVWLDSSGYAVSGHIGFNYMMPSLWVVGVEAEIGYLGVDTERIVIKDDDVLRLSTGLFGTARARLGYAFGRFMPYVTAGFAFVDIENAGGNPANANRFLTISETRPGVAVGAGAEYAFSPGIIGRLEYLYIDTAAYEVRNLENEMMKFDNDMHLVRAGLSFKF